MLSKLHMHGHTRLHDDATGW